MEEGFVKRWLAQVDEYRWLMYTDEEDIQEWDAILEVRMPEQMAYMLDLIQSNYFHMQMYFEAQWELMQKKLALDAGEEGVSGDDVAFMEAFNDIILKNNLDPLTKEKDDDE